MEPDLVVSAPAPQTDVAKLGMENSFQFVELPPDVIRQTMPTLQFS